MIAEDTCNLYGMNMILGDIWLPDLVGLIEGLGCWATFNDLFSF
jgi:hypothetical protein